MLLLEMIYSVSDTLPCIDVYTPYFNKKLAIEYFFYWERKVNTQQFEPNWQL